MLTDLEPDVAGCSCRPAVEQDPHPLGLVLVELHLQVLNSLVVDLRESWMEYEEGERS